MTQIINSRKEETIVSMIKHEQKVILATESAVYDVTDETKIKKIMVVDQNKGIVAWVDN